MYVCTYVCMYVRISSVYMCVCMYVYCTIYVPDENIPRVQLFYVHVSIYVCMSVCTYACYTIHIFLCMYVYMYNTHICIIHIYIIHIGIIQICTNV